MPATISDYIPTTFSATANNAGSATWFKGLMTAMGIPTTQIQHESGTNITYKFTNGVGTYADTYVRFTVANTATWSAQVGSGWNTGTNALTGSGTNQFFLYVAYAGAFSFYKTVISSDNSYRGLLYFDTNLTYTGSVAFITPTNTTLTASNCQLTFIATHIPGATFIEGLGYIKPEAIAGYGPSTAGEYVAKQPYTFTTLKNGLYPVLPNAPISSHGYPIGYNSNLATSNPNLTGGDKVIVTAGVEEYFALDSYGLLIRQI